MQSRFFIAILFLECPVLPSPSQSYKRLYWTRRWRVMRASQLAAQPLCCFCKQRGLIVEAGVVDHIKPHKGDESLFFAPENLQSLCKPCHDGAKAEAESRGFVRGCGLDGLPLDQRHHWHHPTP